MKLFLLVLLLLSCIFGIYSSDPAKLLSAPPRHRECRFTKDIFVDNQYRKSACFMELNLTQNDAKRVCEGFQMKLFVMTDEMEASDLLDAAQEKYPGTDGLIWVNGERRTLSKRWEITDINGMSIDHLNPNIPFYSNHESGNCLRISPKYTGIYGVLPGNCSVESHFVCEYHEQTEEPPRPDPSICTYIRDLRGIKTLCIIFKSYDYDESRRICAKYGMNLFMFDSAEVDEAFFEATEDILLKYPGGYFWVNGQRNPQTNEWFVYQSNRVLHGPLYEKFEWLNLRNINGISNGNFLRLSGEFGPYQGNGVESKHKNCPICEF